MDILKYTQKSGFQKLFDYNLLRFTKIQWNKLQNAN